MSRLRSLTYWSTVISFTMASLQLPITTMAQDASVASKETDRLMGDLQNRLGGKILFSAPKEFIQKIDDQVSECKDINCFYKIMNSHAEDARKAYKTAMEQLYPSVGNSASIRAEVDKAAKACLKSEEWTEYLGCQVVATEKVVRLLETIREDRKERKTQPQKYKTEYPFLKVVLGATCGVDQSNECFDKNIDALIKQGETSVTSLFDTFKSAIVISRIGWKCATYKTNNESVFDCSVPLTGHASWADFIAGKTVEGKTQFVQYKPLNNLYFSPKRVKKEEGSEVPMPPAVPISNEGSKAFICPQFLAPYKEMKLNTKLMGDLLRVFRTDPYRIEIQKSCVEDLRNHFYADVAANTDVMGPAGYRPTTMTVKTTKEFQNYLKVLNKESWKLTEMSPTPCDHYLTYVKGEKKLEEQLQNLDFEKVKPTSALYSLFLRALEVVKKESQQDLGYFAMLRQAEMIALSMVQSDPSIVKNDKAWTDLTLKIESKISCIPSDMRKPLFFSLEKAREELKLKLPNDPQETLEKWITGLKQIAKDAKNASLVIQTLKEILPQVNCAKKTPDSASLDLLYNYSGMLTREYAKHQVFLDRIAAIEKLAQIENRDVSVYMDKQYKTTCGQLRFAYKNAQKFYQNSLSNEPVLLKKMSHKKHRYTYYGTLIDLINNEAYDYYREFKQEAAVKVTKEVVDEGLKRLEGICTEKIPGVIKEGSRLVTTDGMLQMYVGCQDIPEDKVSCEQRRSTGWLLCRNYHEAYSQQKDEQYFATLKTVGTTAGFILAGLASIPSLGGSAALAAAIGLPLGAFLTADEVIQWQKARMQAPGKRDDFMINKWGSMAEFEKAMENLSQDQGNFIMTQLLVNGLPMALDAIALVRFVRGLNDASVLAQRTAKIKELMQDENFQRVYSQAMKNADEVGLKPLSELKGPIAQFVEKSGVEGEKYVEGLRQTLSSTNYYGPVVKTLAKDDVVLLALVEERLNALKTAKGIGATEIARAREQIIAAMTSCSI